ncbi:Zn(2)-C6 fungal-type domain-containing protein [Mycena chlorophos]|uniref:Zn(2)-C6 fungal-type domain-containing protein n=1 Tax=Mycena chlorophos TaxID=658473 RepID=A0A8H6WEV4_MYCCL|nr:Zn(2)-C6 fungal-type domain-containing protein [Mycena chlorophos]
MPSSLPPEIWRIIFDYTTRAASEAPRPWEGGLYKPFEPVLELYETPGWQHRESLRRRTCLALCRVSRLFRAIATELLYRDVCVCDVEGLESLLSGLARSEREATVTTPTLGSYIRRLELPGPARMAIGMPKSPLASTPPPTHQLADLLAYCPNLEVFVRPALPFEAASVAFWASLAHTPITLKQPMKSLRRLEWHETDLEYRLCGATQAARLRELVLYAPHLRYLFLCTDRGDALSELTPILPRSLRTLRLYRLHSETSPGHGSSPTPTRRHRRTSSSLSCGPGPLPKTALSPPSAPRIRHLILHSAPSTPILDLLDTVGKDVRLVELAFAPQATFSPNQMRRILLRTPAVEELAYNLGAPEISALPSGVQAASVRRVRLRVNPDDWNPSRPVMCAQLEVLLGESFPGLRELVLHDSTGWLVKRESARRLLKRLVEKGGTSFEYIDPLVVWNSPDPHFPASHSHLAAGAWQCSCIYCELIHTHPYKPSRRVFVQYMASSSLKFSVLSETEVIDLKRTRGLIACAECQQRKLRCDKKFPCTSCVRRGKADVCPTGYAGPIGRGRRVPRFGSPQLMTAIFDMSKRIRQLEQALAETGESHPLLRDDLLRIKETSELPRNDSVDDADSQLADSFGALVLSASGSSRYYGPGAGHAALVTATGRSGSDRAEYSQAFARFTNWFSLSSVDSEWDVPLSIELLYTQLPDAARAAELGDIFIATGSFYGALVMPNDVPALIAGVYYRRPEYSSAHTLSVLFFVFAHAAFFDLSLPAYSSEADAFFDAGRAALALESVFESTNVRTIQALGLAGLYYTNGGPRFSVDGSWTLTSMAMMQAHRLGLHKESSYEGLDEKISRIRRDLFWELYSLETYQALSLSRPLTLPIHTVTCKFSADTEATTTPDGQVIPGCMRYLHSFNSFLTCNQTFKRNGDTPKRHVTAMIAEAYSHAKMLRYDEVLEIDRKLRRFIEGTRDVFKHYADAGRTPGPRSSLPFIIYTRANLIPRFCGNLLLYIHRTAFVQALKDNPTNPLEGPFAGSFLAAYRGALSIVKSDTQSFELFPASFHRWWPMYKSLSNASFILGSIVCKAPMLDFASTALSCLEAAIRIFEVGATQSFLADGCLPMLRRLYNTACIAYASAHPESPHVPGIGGPAPTLDLELVDDTDLELLAGLRATSVLDPGSATRHSSESPPADSESSRAGTEPTPSSRIARLPQPRLPTNTNTWDINPMETMFSQGYNPEAMSWPIPGPTPSSSYAQRDAYDLFSPDLYGHQGPSNVSEFRTTDLDWNLGPGPGPFLSSLSDPLQEQHTTLQ